MLTTLGKACHTWPQYTDHTWPQYTEICPEAHPLRSERRQGTDQAVGCALADDWRGAVSRTELQGSGALRHGPQSHQVIALAATGHLGMAAAGQIQFRLAAVRHTNADG